MTEWTTVNSKQKKVEKIDEPCWFYNTYGCKNKDGTPKDAQECKYQHVFSTNIKRPAHLSTDKPCDKFNLEGYCKYTDLCKYSHRNLNKEEWEQFYPNAPYSLRINIIKRLNIENKVVELEERIKILEYRIQCMDREFCEKLEKLI